MNHLDIGKNVFLMTRSPIWVLIPQNLDDHQTLSIFEHVGSHVTSISLSQLFFVMVTSIFDDIV